MLFRGTAADESTTKDNIDDIIKQHHDMQEKVAEEMIRMAQSMKHNSLVARDIIKADNQVGLLLMFFKWHHS